MPEPVWYYARGEVERGPFNAVQIKALVIAGKVRPDDLVWKEGMENWTSASEVSELFPNGKPAVESKTDSEPTNGLDVAPAPRSSFPALAPAASLELAELARVVGRGCLLIGVLTAVLARGCDTLGQQRLSRLDASAHLQAAAEFRRQRASLTAEHDALKEKTRPTPGDLDRLREMTESLGRIDAAEAAGELPAAQKRSIDESTSEFRAGAFYRGLALYGGVLFLLVAGFVLSMFATGTDRWLGTGILIVLCFWVLTSADVK